MSMRMLSVYNCEYLNCVPLVDDSETRSIHYHIRRTRYSRGPKNGDRFIKYLDLPADAQRAMGNMR